jgi:hypothetical protein
LQSLRRRGAGEFDGALLALWWDGKGDWEKAHQIAQDVAGLDGAWVYAHLHRKEGDVGNAAYWYRVAGRAVATGDFRREWEGIVEEFLAQK